MKVRITKELLLAFYKSKFHRFLLNWLDLVIKINTRYPVAKKDEDGEIDLVDPQITVTEELLGFAVVDLRPYLLDPDLAVQQQKYAVFEYKDEHIFKNSELYWPLPNESEIEQSQQAVIEELRQKKYFPKKEAELTELSTAKGKAPVGKNLKKPAAQKKKPQKPAAKGKKGAVEEEAIKVQILDWANDSRKTIVYKNDFLGVQNMLKNPNNHFLVSGVKKLSVEVAFN